MKKTSGPIYEIISDVILPKSHRGRPRKDDRQSVTKSRRGRRPNDDSEWIDLAKKGVASGKYANGNEAASDLSKHAKGACPKSTRRRLNYKFKKAGID
jgi:hypothetical protein